METEIVPQVADQGFVTRLTNNLLEKQRDASAEDLILLYKETVGRFIRHMAARTADKDYTLGKAHQYNEMGIISPPLPTSTIEEMVEAEYSQIEEGKNQDTVGLQGRTFLPGVLAEVIKQNYNILATPKSNSGKGGEVCYLYRGGTYRPEGADFVVEEAHRLLSFFDASKPARLAEVLSLVKITESIDQDLMNPQAMDLINCLNGMVEWRTGELKPHDSKYLSTFQINSIYDPGAKSDLLDDFFSSVFNEDAIMMVEEFIGYLLIPSSQFHKSFICLGPGGNGKSTFLTILENFLGARSLSFESLHELQTNTFSRANLLDKIANIHHEVSSQMLESTGIFKSLVSGDTISAQFKHQNSFTFTPYARLLFAANEFPRSQDQTDAYYQRLMFVEFPKVFRGSTDEISDFAGKATSDPVFCSALLNRALQGLCRLIERGKFSPCGSSEKLVEEYRKSNANSTQAFMAEAFDFGPNFLVKRGEVYDIYSEWAERVGMGVKGRNKFLAEIKCMGYAEVREGVNRDWCFQGMQWKPEFNPIGLANKVADYGKQIG